MEQGPNGDFISSFQFSNSFETMSMIQMVNKIIILVNQKLIRQPIEKWWKILQPIEK